jgi:xanthine dehydrogenase/oxidase
MENIMEHIASNIGMDPLEFRLHNMVTEGDLLFTKPFKMVEANPLPTIISDLKRTSNYDERMQQIQTFNSQNKWKKRGLSLVPMLYVQDSANSTFYFQLTIYRGDGTIAISHGGVEMGQVIISLFERTRRRKIAKQFSDGAGVSL